MHPGPFFPRMIEKFFKDDVTTLAASLSFYTALSLAPLLILFVAVSSHLSLSLQQDFLGQTRGLVGADAAGIVQTVVESSKQRTDLTSLAGILGVITLLLSASLIFGQLRSALNKIFAVDPPDLGLTGASAVIVQFLRERLMHVMFALVCIFGMIASLLASSVLSSSLKVPDHTTARLLSVGTSFFFYVFLFTTVFRYLPDRTQPWKSTFQGGLLTSILFEIGKELIGIYLGRSAVGSAYGAAGSLIALLVWVYYSALITFVGAEVSSLLDAHGSVLAVKQRPETPV